MDVLVMLEESPDHSPVVAQRETSVPSSATAERPARDVVTLYGEPYAASALHSHWPRRWSPTAPAWGTTIRTPFAISAYGRSAVRWATPHGATT